MASFMIWCPLSKTIILTDIQLGPAREFTTPGRPAATGPVGPASVTVMMMASVTQSRVGESEAAAAKPIRAAESAAA